MADTEEYSQIPLSLPRTHLCSVKNGAFMLGEDANPPEFLHCLGFFFPTTIEVKLSNKHKILLCSYFCLILILQLSWLQFSVASCTSLVPTM